MKYNIEEKLPENFYVFKKDEYNKGYFREESSLFLEALDRATKENDIQRYIKESDKWFIPLSILKDYDFGHHFACVVPEYSLGAEYIVDYMLIGKNSIGYNIVFVEFEDVNVDYRLKKSNTESDKVRKGITQIRDWKRWIEENKSYFMNREGIRSISNNIPSWAFWYCLVVGRRERMDDMANKLRGEIQREIRGLHIISYDRLVDNIKMMSNGI